MGIAERSVTEKSVPLACGEGYGVGGSRLELLTSTMSTWRSNQLS
jgi:hypothetical protein